MLKDFFHWFPPTKTSALVSSVQQWDIAIFSLIQRTQWRNWSEVLGIWFRFNHWFVYLGGGPLANQCQPQDLHLGSWGWYCRRWTSDLSSATRLKFKSFISEEFATGRSGSLAKECETVPLCETLSFKQTRSLHFIKQILWLRLSHLGVTFAGGMRSDCSALHLWIFLKRKGLPAWDCQPNMLPAPILAHAL